MRHHVEPQPPLWTALGRPNDPGADTRDLRILLCRHVAEVFHCWNGGQPLELGLACPECGTELLASVVMPIDPPDDTTAPAAAWCPECGWVMAVDIPVKEANSASRREVK